MSAKKRCVTWVHAPPAHTEQPQNLTPLQSRLVQQLRDALAVGNIKLHRDFFSLTEEKGEILSKIKDELCRFAIVVEAPKTLFGRVRRTFTGKLGGMQDDLAIVIQLAITALRCFYQNEKYSSFRRES